MLQLKNFVKSYGSVPVLEVEDLVIQPGCYSVQGVNGSGKSTLLKAIAGILYFNGEILLNNISVKKQTVAYRKLVNFSEAEPVFPEFLTGWEMLKVFASAKGSLKGQEDYYIESMKMNPYIHQPIRSYSSGMLKKLSILLAFIGNPKVILLDEPLITIDEASLKILYQWIGNKCQDGTSFLLSSHQPFGHDELKNTKLMIVESQQLKLMD
jgi:ABC-2 type transport system ATP-binding protein